ncbi:MAG: DipZ protein [Solirubrobacterales bacterium]
MSRTPRTSITLRTVPQVDQQHIIAPDLPAGATWLNERRVKIDVLLRRGPVMIEFWDFARINSLRTMPYMEEWHRRYHPHGASVIGVHSPGYTFGADEQLVTAAVKRLGIERPVILDPSFSLWRDYGNKGWPGRYLWSVNGDLRYYHYGEGDYETGELALQNALREFGVCTELPAPMSPIRPEDTPGSEFRAQTADIALPPETDRVELRGEWEPSADWIEAKTAGATATASCDAGGAYAVLSGRRVTEPGPHPLAIEAGRVTVTASEPGMRLHGFQFTPAPGL